MNIFPNETLSKIPAVMVTKDILDTYNALYPAEDIKDIDILAEIYPNIVGILQNIGIEEDYDTYNMYCLLCQYWKGLSGRVIREFFSAIGSDIISNPNISITNGNISIIIDSVRTFNISNFTQLLTNFISEYAFDNNNSVSIVINSVQLPVSKKHNSIISVIAETGKTFTKLEGRRLNAY